MRLWRNGRPGSRHKVVDMLRVHMAETPEPEILDYLDSILDDRVVFTTGNTPEPADYAVLVDGEPTREKLQAAPNLRAVIQPYTGVAPETAALMREFSHLTLYNSHGPALPTAEMAFALLLAAAKAIIPLDRALREDDWSPRRRPIPSILLSGKTALLLGYGAIGRHVARDVSRYGDGSAGGATRRRSPAGRSCAGLPHRRAR